MKATFKEVVELWKEDKRQYVKHSSYAIYVALLNKHILPYFKAAESPGSGGQPAPAERQIREFAASLTGKGYSPKTVKDALMVLKMIIRFGEKLQAWPHAEYDVHIPDTPPGERRTIENRDLRRLTQYLGANLSFRNLGILICIHTGIRIGEACGLRWGDIDTAEGVLRINRTVQRICLSDNGIHEYYLSVGSPKTASGIREIPLSKELGTILRPIVKLMPPERYLLSNSGKPCEPRYLRDYFYSILRKLGIPRVRFHALRHSFATRCIEGRCDYKTVSIILGHASISTTMDLYVHPGRKEKKRVIERAAGTLC